ncbi:MAG TPA: AGE family epimerase/isomerase [Bryobacteraceae bacterium]|nr:AGE family epimerase/isomerase [Bryobacteraceae bacterium]
MQAAEFRKELTENILPFWMRHTVDREHGGFYGRVSCDLKVDEEAPRAAVINGRILWTYSAAYRLLGNPEYREMADHAYAYIVDKFWDKQYGGVYWLLDHLGNPISDRKQIYAQAFAIYGLAEYYRATGKAESLDRAQQLFRLTEEKSRDKAYGGYLEACGRDWGALDDLRLSAKDLNCPKSMNTHLHVMEAYTNLLRVWKDPELAARQKALLEVTMDDIVDGATGHFRLFFDRQWNSLTDHISFGHDIEGSWLIYEAAEVLGDPELFARARRLATEMAFAVYEQGLDKDGSLFYEANSKGVFIDPNKHWWAQAEAVVGFYNAWQLSRDVRFLEASRRAWEYIETHVVDRVHGEWHAKLTPAGVPFTEKEDPSDACLVGPWKCPYHNSRVCFEMMERLEKGGA